MKKKLFAIISISLILLMLFSSCSKGVSESIGSMDQSMKEESFNDSLNENTSLMDGGSSEVSNSKSDEDRTESLGNRKIIQNFDLSVQTKEFDTLLKKIQEELASLGGYVQESTTHGREIGSAENRSATMVLRVPAKNSASFDAFLSENSVVISRNVSTEDVTLSYVDMESRVSALESEKIALEELLKNASNVEEIIKIREKLTDVIYEIESYKSKLRTYDNLVDYCTVSIFINEVERTTVVEKQSVWQEIGTNLKNNFESVWDGAVSLFIFFTSSIPFLIPILLVAVILILCLRTGKKKRKMKNNSQESGGQK